MAEKISRKKLALEFNARYGVNLRQRVSKLIEEVMELKEALEIMTDWEKDKTVLEQMEQFETFRDEVRDAASVMNQLEHLLLPPTWPEDVHKLLKERDSNPDYERRHEHVRNEEAGE